jgi:ribonuclease P protein component
MREAHVPAQQPEAEEEARIPRPHALEGRARGHSVATQSRSQATLRLIWRVRDRGTFAALSRAPRARRGPVTLRFVPDPDAGRPRVAFAVGRAMGNAVARNRVRRRLRAAVAGLGDELGPGAYLFGADARAVRATFAELRDAVTALVHETGSPT